MYEILNSSHLHVIAVKFSGRLTKSEYVTVAQQFKTVMAEHNRLSILMDITELESFEKSILLYDSKFTRKYYKLYDKIALIGGSYSIGLITRIGCWCLRCKAKQFPGDQSSQAYEWIAVD